MDSINAIELITAFGEENIDPLQLIALMNEEKGEDIALIDYILNTKNRVYYYLDRERGVFRLDDLGDSYCVIHFRFFKDDIRRLVKAFGLPEVITLKTRVKVSGEEAMCILLHRLAYPKRLFIFHSYSSLFIHNFVFRSFFRRYFDQMNFFPRGRSVLSEIFNLMIDFILKEKEQVLKGFNQPYLTRDKIEELCNTISEKGSPYKRCFGFIDGTVRAVCRPTVDQREVTLDDSKYNFQ